MTVLMLVLLELEFLYLVSIVVTESPSDEGVLLHCSVIGLVFFKFVQWGAAAVRWNLNIIIAYRAAAIVLNFKIELLNFRLLSPVSLALLRCFTARSRFSNFTLEDISVGWIIKDQVVLRRADCVLMLLWVIIHHRHIFVSGCFTLDVIRVLPRMSPWNVHCLRSRKMVRGVSLL
jgi:hypothetical protein